MKGAKVEPIEHPNCEKCQTNEVCALKTRIAQMYGHHLTNIQTLPSTVVYEVRFYCAFRAEKVDASAPQDFIDVEPFSKNNA